MNIAVIGTGNVGSALAKKWAKAGHRIFLGVKDIDNFKGKALLELAHVSVHSVAEAVEKAEVILIAAVPQATSEIVKAMGDVTDKVIIDAMNSVRLKPDGHNNTYEALRALAPLAEVVKCFNCTGFENMEDPLYPGNMRIDMFAAGDSKIAKELASQLARDAGFENCYDFGGADKVALLEQFALVWINLAIMQGMGRGIAFKLLKR